MSPLRGALHGERHRGILEIEVKARKRRIVRSRWLRACTCPFLPTEAIAEPVPRLFANTPCGISIRATLLYERYAGLRPLNRVAAWMSDHGLAMSTGTLANGTKSLVPLFEPVADAILAHLNQAPVRGADETSWRIRSLWSQFGSGRAWPVPFHRGNGRGVLRILKISDEIPRKTSISIRKEPWISSSANLEGHF